MKKKSVRKGAFAIAAAAILLLAGCRSNADNNTETEALKAQIAQLEQQIAALEQQAANGNAFDDTAASETMSAPETIPQQTDTSVGNSQRPDTIAGDNTQILPGANAGGSHVPGHNEERYHNSAHDTAY